MNSAADWRHAASMAFIPDNPTWVTLEDIDGLTPGAADHETLLTMNFAVGRDNYRIMFNDAPDVAVSLPSETEQ